MWLKNTEDGGFCDILSGIEDMDNVCDDVQKRKSTGHVDTKVVYLYMGHVKYMMMTTSSVHRTLTLMPSYNYSLYTTDTAQCTRSGTLQQTVHVVSPPGRLQFSAQAALTSLLAYYSLCAYSP